jgi:thiamine-phosphate pyrophosphorylase
MAVPSDPMDALLNAAEALMAARHAQSQALGAGTGAVSLPCLWFFTDPKRTPDPLKVIARLPQGTGVVHRAFGRDEALSHAIIDACKARGIIVLIGKDERLARSGGAHGVHLPASDMARAAAIREAWPRAILTESHHEQEPPPAVQALDALFLSPLFETRSGAGRRPLGTDVARAISASVTCPVYGLGGITVARARALKGTGLAGFAAIDAVVSAAAYGQGRRPD